MWCDNLWTAPAWGQRPGRYRRGGVVDRVPPDDQEEAALDVLDDPDDEVLDEPVEDVPLEDESLPELPELLEEPLDDEELEDEPEPLPDPDRESVR